MRCYYSNSCTHWQWYVYTSTVICVHVDSDMCTRWQWYVYTSTVICVHVDSDMTVICVHVDSDMTVICVHVDSDMCTCRQWYVYMLWCGTVQHGLRRMSESCAEFELHDRFHLADAMHFCQRGMEVSHHLSVTMFIIMSQNVTCCAQEDKVCRDLTCIAECC